MKIYYVLVGALLVFNLEGCTSAEDKKSNAQAEYTEEKTETLKEYKECVKDAGGDQGELAQCEALLKAVGVMEGGTVQSSVPAPAESTAPATE